MEKQKKPPSILEEGQGLDKRLHRVTIPGYKNETIPQEVCDL